MAVNQPKSNIEKNGRQSLERDVTFIGKRPQGIKKQRSQRSIREGVRQKETLHQWIESKDKDTESKNSFSSPPTSNTPSKKDPQSSPVLPKAKDSLKRSQSSTLDSRPEEFEQPCYQNGHETGRELERKRKRSHEAEYPTSRVQEEPIGKRARTSLASCAVEDKEAASNTSNKGGHAINYWTQRGNWPEEYFESDSNMNQQLSRKHSSSGMSYTQSVKDGENPPAYSPEYEVILAKAGIYMYQYLGQTTISDICKELCVTLLGGEYEPPEHSLFQDNFFWITLEKVRSKNEARVVRDITPLIVPSAELLYTRGVQDLQYLIEEINAEWTKCICLAGPRPKPDYAVGLISSTFTDDEVQRLKLYTSPAKATLFTGNFYFPFLMCEVKCGENGLNIADRQNAHSTSMAIDAIVQLYRKASEGKELRRENQTVARLMDLNRKILVFSISHDHAMVRIFGHYPLIDGDKTTFHRHLIREFSFRDQDGKEKWTAYNFTRKIYDTFVPIHLDRIRNAIVRLPNPEFESFTSIASTENESDLPDSQELATSAPSSQGNAKFKKPKLPPKAMLQKEVDRQSQDIDQLKQDNAGLKGQNKELMDRLNTQNEQMNSRLNQLVEQMLNQQTPSNGNTGNKLEGQRMLQQENDRLKREKEQSKQENDRLRQEMKQEKDRLKEFIDLWKQQNSANA